MAEELYPSISRIMDINGRFGGLGFLFTKRLIFTCAHVVCKALGLNYYSEQAPDVDLLIDFPYVSSKKPIAATIYKWEPLRPDGSGDIAVLLLDEKSFMDIKPGKIVRSNELEGHQFSVFGYPQKTHPGTFATGEFNGRTPIGTILIISDDGPRVREGFSGSPVWDRKLKKIIGIVSAVDQDVNARAAYIIPVEHLLRLIPLEPEMIFVPAGDFWMNETNNEKLIKLPEFYISKSPITIEQYRFFVESTSRPWHGDYGTIRNNHPACLTSWEDEIAYCAWLSEITGKNYRLPFEDEWVKAARGGRILPSGVSNPLPQRPYPWGDERPNDRLCKIGPRIISSLPGNMPDTAETGSHPNGSSPYGCVDMLGNVSERCTIRGSQDKNVTALRGGNWTEPAERIGIVVRSILPGNLPPSVMSGMRIVREV